MKKYLMTAMAAVALGSAFVSCTRDIAEYNAAESFQQRYEDAFIQLFGQPAANQDWGFGSFAKAAGSRVTGVATRSQSSPVVYSIDAPFDETFVSTYVDSATEPNSANTAENSGTLWSATQGSILQKLMNNYDYCTNDGVLQTDKDWYTDNILPLLKYYWDQNIYNMPNDTKSREALNLLEKQ